MFKIITRYPIATDSPDHLNPYGCILNNSGNSKFNKRLYELIPEGSFIMDLGCAGGGFVNECLNDGYIAVGLEGSNEPLKKRIGFWPQLYNQNLFTCDVARRFCVLYENKDVMFNVITAWELLEHIHTNDINTFLNNMIYHLDNKGLFIVSINTASKEHSKRIYGKDWGPKDIFPDKHFHHQNVETIEWWDKKFAEFKLYDNKELRESFGGEFVRGPGHGADKYATEERMKIPDLPVELQWATINRVLELR